MSTSAELSAIFNKKIRQRYSKTDIIEALELAATGSTDSGIYVPKTGGTFTGSVTIDDDFIVNQTLTVGGDLDVSVGNITGQTVTGGNLNISNWDTAFGWGDWSTGVDKTFVDALGINATNLGGEPLTRFMLLDDSPVPVFADGDVPVYQSADQTFTNLTLSTVATTNSYDDLDDKPTIYTSWTISDGSNTESVIDGFTLEIVGQGIVSTSYSAIDNRLTISATEADTLDTVTGRGATTSNNVTVGNLNAAVITGTGSFSLPKISSDINGVLVQDVLTLNPITTTERNALTETEGMLIANSTTNALEYYNGTSWV